MSFSFRFAGVLNPLTISTDYHLVSVWQGANENDISGAHSCSFTSKKREEELLVMDKTPMRPCVNKLGKKKKNCFVTQTIKCSTRKYTMPFTNL